MEHAKGIIGKAVLIHVLVIGFATGLSMMYYRPEAVGIASLLTTIVIAITEILFIKFNPPPINTIRFVNGWGVILILFMCSFSAIFIGSHLIDLYVIPQHEYY